MIGLLDTHSFLWSVIAPDRLSPRARGLIADPANEIHVSTVSFWEIALKYSIGKLELTGCTPEELQGIAGQMNLSITAPSAAESAGFHRLGRFAHKDPYDRMLIWQCMQRGWSLVTRDRGIDEYRNLGLITVW